MVDDLYGDAAGLRLVEGARGVAVQRCPCLFVDFCLESSLQSFVGIVGAEEVGLADEETLFVVVVIHEPAGDALGTVTADFARIGMKYIHAIDLYLDLVVFRFEDFNVWLAEASALSEASIETLLQTRAPKPAWELSASPRSDAVPGFDPYGVPTTLFLNSFPANLYVTSHNTDPSAAQITSTEWAIAAAIGEDNPNAGPTGVNSDGTNSTMVMFYGVIGGVCSGAGGVDAPFHFISGKPISHRPKPIWHHRFREPHHQSERKFEQHQSERSL